MEYACRQSVAVFAAFLAFHLCCAQTGRNDDMPMPDHATATETVFPSWLGDGFFITSTDHFCVAHDISDAESQQLADCLENAYTKFYRFFGQYGFELEAPPGRLSWISFSHLQHFSSYARRADRMDLSRLGGYYSARTNRVAIIHTTEYKAPAGTEPVGREMDETSISAIGVDEADNQFVKIAHELAHQLSFNSGLQTRGVMYSLWVSEGLATQYETELSYCRNINLARLERLLQLRADERLIPLEELIVLTRLPASQAMREDVYAQAWGFFNFLLRERPVQLKAYLDALCALRPGFRDSSTLLREFTTYFGSIEDLNQAWIRYIHIQ